jgi:hypothetical protein
MAKIALTIWIMVFLLLGPALEAAAYEPAKQEEIELYVMHFHRNMKERYTEKALKLVPMLMKHAINYDVDPMLVAETFSGESSWRNFRGSKGEVGPGHVMPRWAKQFNLKTLDGQIEACVHMLKTAIVMCPTLEQAISRYMSGSCKPRTKRTARMARRRARKYRKARVVFCRRHGG